MKSNAISIAAIACATLLAGCATTSTMPPGTLKVDYSRTFINGAKLKEIPGEVQIVRREDTGNAVAGQVGLNVLMLALGGGIATNGFSKDDLKGAPIEGVDDRTYLQNPVPTAFVQSLQKAVDARMEQDKLGQTQSFRYPLVVGGGSAQLVYDTLTGAGDANYQLLLNLDVYKRRESNWVMPARLVQCSGRSEPAQPLSYWAEASYRNVQQELSRMLAACQDKVVAELPTLLEQ
ncbi:hypothetical protein [Comamonas odontotermitis]|uniref:hypothetical protein n=1 Tax=Comamonas odontotermitis TaxID=379895 RepID=UPI0037508B9D